jgi:hypothetical protein
VSDRALSPRTDLPYVEMRLKSKAEKPYVDPATLQRTYTFEVIFTSDPPEGTFSGEIEIPDPWDEAQVKRLLISGRASPPVRVSPPLLLLAIGGAGSPPPSARLSVTSRGPLADVVAEPEEASGPLLVERIPDPEASRVARFRVRVKPDHAVVPGTYNLAVRAGPSGENSVIVPVSVRKEGADGERLP